MRAILIPLAVACLALTGCQDKNKAGDGSPKTADQVAREAADLPKPQPGLYRTSVDIKEMKAPGLPPQFAERMKEMMAQKVTTAEFCLTEADAAKGYGERVRKSAGQQDCTFDRYEADGGNLDARMTCKIKDAGTMTLDMKGTMSPTGSDMTMAMTQNGGVPGGMNMIMRIKSERVGDCKS